jgi:hypothetical protein
VAQDNSHSRGPKGGPPGKSPPESAPTVPEMPAVDVGEKRSSSAPTAPMKPVRPAERGIHSAPTVPMKPVRFSDLVPEEAPPAKAASRPAPPPEPSRPQASRPAVPAVTNAPPPAAPAQPAAKPGVAAAPASEASRSVPAVTKFPERPAADRAVTTSPGRTAAPPKRPAEEPPTDVPRKAGQSTSVMLKASHLHKLAEQAEKERKFALTRKGSARSTRAPFPSVRAPAPSPERPAPPVPTASLPPVTGPRPALGSNPRVLLGGETTGPQQVHRPDVNLVYDGRAPAEGLSITHPETSLRAPVQSYPGQRTVIHTQNVINQYAVAVNPRYAPRAQEPRDSGHLFVFDVMSSQHTTLERAFSAGSSGNFRPGTAAELWKWLNETAPSRGWRAVEGPALQEAAAKGLPIIALAKTAAGLRFAVVEPGPQRPGGKLLLASAHEPRGQRQTPEQIFGSSAVRYLAHD